MLRCCDAAMLRCRFPLVLQRYCYLPEDVLPYRGDEVNGMASGNGAYGLTSSMLLKTAEVLKGVLEDPNGSWPRTLGTKCLPYGVVNARIMNGNSLVFAFLATGKLLYFLHVRGLCSNLHSLLVSCVTVVSFPPCALFGCI